MIAVQPNPGPITPVVVVVVFGLAVIDLSYTAFKLARNDSPNVKKEIVALTGRVAFLLAVGVTGWATLE